MPLYKEMINKVTLQETQKNVQRKNQQNGQQNRIEKRRKSANKQAAAALKGMNDAMGIKKLDTISEFR